MELKKFNLKKINVEFFKFMLLNGFPQIVLVNSVKPFGELYLTYIQEAKIFII